MKIMVCGMPVYKIRIDEALSNRALDSFGEIWQMHPAKPGMYTFASGRTVQMPRYQQAYDNLYSFGSDGGVLPLPELFRPYADWLADNVCERYNGAMVTWYDSHLGHYIGPHKDDTRQLVEGDPICSLSFGATRRMRFCRKDYDDEFVEIAHGDVVIIPYETNRYVLHGVDKGQTGLRVSFTARSFLL